MLLRYNPAFIAMGSNHPHRHAGLCFALAAAVLVVCAACDERPQITTYTAPKDQPRPDTAPPPPPGGALDQPPPATTALLPAADLPEGWAPVNDPAPPRLAAYTVTDGQRTGEVAITRFPGDVGGELANVNRWRRQLGLPPTDTLDPAAPRRLTKDGFPCTLYIIRPPSPGSTPAPGSASGSEDQGAADPQPDPDTPMITVAAIRDAESTWFIKFTGPRRLVADQAVAFSTFVLAVDLPLEGPPPPPSPEGAATGLNDPQAAEPYPPAPTREGGDE